jgi:hypothetical protein
VASGQLDRPDPASGGRIVYEADAQGRLQKVDRPGGPPAQGAAPLWKPTPEFLLEHSAALKLSRSQAAGIQKLAADWNREKIALESRIEVAAHGFGEEVSAFGADRRLSTGMITTGLGEYSLLSRHYSERRQATWQQALALLEPAQSKLLPRLAHGVAQPGGRSR